MGTDFRKSTRGKGTTLSLKVLGATADIPLGLQAYGKDCVGGKANSSTEGYFAYLAAPLKGKALFVHEKTTKADGTIFHVWKSSGSKDSPPGRIKLDNMAKKNAGEVQTAVNSMTKAIQSQKALKSLTRLRAMTTLRGRWTGYIECPSGRVVLTRDIANFTTLALVSDPASATWQYAIHIKNLKSTHWFSAASKKVSGLKSVSLTGKKGTLVGAYNLAIKALFEVIAKASEVKETTRRASVDRGYRKKALAKGSFGSPMNKSEVKSAASAGRGLGKGAGRISTKAARLIAKAKAKSSSTGSTAAAPRVRKAAIKSQTALKGKYITFMGDGAGSLKGMVAYVASIGPNGRDNYDPKNGGAKLYIIAINSDGKKVSNRLKGGVLEYVKGKRPFEVKGKSAFNAAMKQRAAEKLLAVADLINEIGGLTQKEVLGARNVKKVTALRAEKAAKAAKKAERTPRAPRVKPTPAPAPVVTEAIETDFFGFD